jgi:cytochrome c oxidase cbb3-type subunit 3
MIMAERWTSNIGGRPGGYRRVVLLSACVAMCASMAATLHAQIGNAAYPARSPADPAAIERGKAIYGVNCQFCHGVDTRGGDGGPSLLRSGIVLDDQRGELMAPVVRAGRPGMPKFTLTDEQMSDVAAFVHSFKA